MHVCDWGIDHSKHCKYSIHGKLTKQARILRIVAKHYEGEMFQKSRTEVSLVGEDLQLILNKDANSAKLPGWLPVSLNLMGPFEVWGLTLPLALLWGPPNGPWGVWQLVCAVPANVCQCVYLIIILLLFTFHMYCLLIYCCSYVTMYTNR